MKTRWLPVLALVILLPHESAGVEIAPHRAVYNMSMDAVKNGSEINDVSGKLLFEWSDTCDGWATQQQLQLHFNYAEGDESNVSSAIISWESKDGKRYNFNVRRMTNDKETENYRGRATTDEKGGIGKYAIPKDKKDAVLPAGTLFPSAHTTLIIQEALEGHKFFTRRVFDGSDEEGSADISAFIGNRLDKVDENMSEDLRKNPLLAKPAWPVRLAFFAPSSETGEPDYEMDLTLQSNGIARYMKIDYGDFSVAGVMSGLEALPPTKCK